MQNTTIFCIIIILLLSNSIIRVLPFRGNTLSNSISNYNNSIQSNEDNR